MERDAGIKVDGRSDYRVEVLPHLKPFLHKIRDIQQLIPRTQNLILN